MKLFFILILSVFYFKLGIAFETDEEPEERILDCQDFLPNCAHLTRPVNASLTGVKCLDLEVQQKCPRSCNVCLPKSPVQDCVDLRPDYCKQLHNRNDCHKNPRIFLTLCAKTCHACPPKARTDCLEDLHPSCYLAAIYGMCDVSSIFHHVYCPKSCAIHIPICSQYKGKNNPSTVYGVCKDKKFYCGELKEAGVAAIGSIRSKRHSFFDLVKNSGNHNSAKDQHHQNTHSHHQNTPRHQQNTRLHHHNTQHHGQNTHSHHQNNPRHPHNTQSHHQNTQSHHQNPPRHHQNTQSHHQNTQSHHQNTQSHQNAKSHHQNTQSHHQNPKPHHQNTQPHSPNSELTDEQIFQSVQKEASAPNQGQTQRQSQTVEEIEANWETSLVPFCRYKSFMNYFLVLESHTKYNSGFPILDEIEDLILDINFCQHGVNDPFDRHSYVKNIYMDRPGILRPPDGYSGLQYSNRYEIPDSKKQNATRQRSKRSLSISFHSMAINQRQKRQTTTDVDGKVAVDFNTILEGSQRSMFQCGGALISPFHVVTAAHCTFRKRSPKTARLGERDFERDDESVAFDYSISNINPHETYSGLSKLNDIAIVLLEHKVDFNEDIQPFCIPKQRRALEGQKCFVSGWGERSANAIRLPEVLTNLELTILNSEECARNYSATSRPRERDLFIKSYPNGRLPDSHFCAGGEQDLICQGDSGGPANIVNEDGKFETVGIVNKGYGCFNRMFPGIYVRTSSFTKWFDEILYGECEDVLAKANLAMAILNETSTEATSIFTTESIIPQVISFHQNNNPHATDNHNSSPTPHSSNVPIANEPSFQPHSNINHNEHPTRVNNHHSIANNHNWHSNTHSNNHHPIRANPHNNHHGSSNNNNDNLPPRIISSNWNHRPLN